VLFSVLLVLRHTIFTPSSSVCNPPSIALPSSGTLQMMLTMLCAMAGGCVDGGRPSCAEQRQARCVTGDSLTLCSVIESLRPLEAIVYDEATLNAWRSLPLSLQVVGRVRRAMEHFSQGLLLD